MISLGRPGQASRLSSYRYTFIPLSTIQRAPTPDRARAVVESHTPRVITALSGIAHCALPWCMEYEMDRFLSVPPSRNGSPTQSRRTSAMPSVPTHTPPRQPSLASLADRPPHYRSVSHAPSLEGNMPYQHLGGSPAPSFSVLGANASPALSETSFDFGKLEEQPLVSAFGRRHARSESLESDPAVSAAAGWSRRKKIWVTAAALLVLAAAAGGGVVAYLRLGRQQQVSSPRTGGHSTSSTLHTSKAATSTSTTNAAAPSSTLNINGWTSDMVYPSGYPGTGLNGRLSTTKPSSKPVYTQLLA